MAEKDTLSTTLAHSIADHRRAAIAVRVTTLVQQPSLARLTNELLAVRVTTLINFDDPPSFK